MYYDKIDSGLNLESKVPKALPSWLGWRGGAKTGQNVSFEFTETTV